jgi:leucyl/phenylalanyl-tRNA--protein transferase
MTAGHFDFDAIMSAYAQGFFPMADGRTARGFSWYAAPMRSLLPLDLHIPRSLKKFMAKAPFEIRIDTDFAGVLDGCAAPRARTAETWINGDIRAMMLFLHEQGAAHSVECWKDGRLAGGLYGVAQGAAFGGESMFSREAGASKVALVHLCERLKAGGFKLLDTQFINDHMVQFGAYEMPHEAYLEQLRPLLTQQANFSLFPATYLSTATQPAIPGRSRWTQT